MTNYFWREVAEGSLPIPLAAWLNNFSFQMIRVLSEEYGSTQDWGYYLKQYAPNVEVMNDPFEKIATKDHKSPKQSVTDTTNKDNYRVNALRLATEVCSTVQELNESETDSMMQGTYDHTLRKNLKVFGKMPRCAGKANIFDLYY